MYLYFIVVFVFVQVKIYQKISQGIHVPAGKFGIMLESEHHPKASYHHHHHHHCDHHCHDHFPKAGYDLSRVTERVSIKMVSPQSKIPS